MELTEAVKGLLREAAQALKGSERRRFLARTVEELGPGRQRRAERELGWSRVTIRKGLRELRRGVTCVDAFALRGRKRAEAHLPNLLIDLEAVVSGPEPGRPVFSHDAPVHTPDRARGAPAAHRAAGLYQRGTAHREDDRGQAQRVGLPPPAGREEQAPKKIAATDAIFAEVTAINRAADAADGTLRVSLDAKATVTIGPFSRNGRSRVPTAAADHDFQPEAAVTPVGLLLPALDELFLYAVTSRVTSDCLVDRLVQWWEAVRGRFAHVTTLVVNLDNGPENHSHRTQFMHRLVQFAERFHLTVRLAYYPPYHSKYHPVERCWGILEQHWNGTLLDSLDAVLGFATTMTWKGVRPSVALVTTTYERGVTLTKEVMADVETHLTRHPTLGKWFIDILPTPAAPG